MCIYFSPSERRFSCFYMVCCVGFVCVRITTLDSVCSNTVRAWLSLCVCVCETMQGDASANSFHMH